MQISFTAQVQCMKTGELWPGLWLSNLCSNLSIQTTTFAFFKKQIPKIVFFNSGTSGGSLGKNSSLILAAIIDPVLGLVLGLVPGASVRTLWQIQRPATLHLLRSGTVSGSEVSRWLLLQLRILDLGVLIVGPIYTLASQVPK